MTESSEKMHARVYCPSCGFAFEHELSSTGKVVGVVGGASAGAILGAKVGLVLGPLGAIAGTIPGALLGTLFGSKAGTSVDNPQCPKCATKFDVPKRRA